MNRFNYLQLANDLGLYGHVTNDQLNAKCPFHHDSHPSFGMNVRTGLWLCRSGCGEGDFTRLVMRMLSVGVREADSWVRSKGDKVSTQVLSRQIEDLMKPKLTGGLTAVWDDVYNQADSTIMPTWLFNRGFDWSSVKRWGLRWDVVEQAVIIPVWGLHSNLIGLISRNLREDRPRYVNTPAMPKAYNLFGLHLQDRGGVIILVEGPLDCIWLDQLGYPAVAILGSELSRVQADLLQRHSYSRVILALDNDLAGQTGTSKSEDVLVKAGYLPSQVEAIKLPRGKKDVQDCDERLVGDVLGTRQILMIAT